MAFPGIVKKAVRKRTSTGRRRRSGLSSATFIGRSRAESSEQKAIWHNVTGAGRRGVLRKFFDLNASDQDALMVGLERLVGARVRTL